jgi:exopolysaccharide production protein ExoQ
MTARTPFALTAAYVLVVWTLAAFGRDMLFNHNVDADLADDSIGAVLPYLRVAACAFAALAVAGASGLGWSLARLPLSLAPFCLWTLMSVAWTDSPKDTLRGSLTLLAAWGAVPILLHRLGAARSARWLLHVVAAVCIASFLVALLLPGIGRHSAGDLVQGAHDGLWRGIFSHKNGLGPWAAYGVALLPFSGALGVRWPVRLVGSVCALACLVFSGSATGLALAGIGVGLGGLFALGRRWPAGLALAAVAAPVLVGAAAAGGAEALLAALGRSSSLSGRSDIWSLAWGYVAERPWLGYGYATLGGADFHARETSLFAQAIPGPESGYLDLWLETGAVGCGLLLAAYALALVKGFVWLRRAAAPDVQGIEIYLILLLSSLAEAISESNAFIVTGYDGAIFFTALFALATAPWPSGVRRRAFRDQRPQHGQSESGGARPLHGRDHARGEIAAARAVREIGDDDRGQHAEDTGADHVPQRNAHQPA